MEVRNSWEKVETLFSKIRVIVLSWGEHEEMTASLMTADRRPSRSSPTYASQLRLLSRRFLFCNHGPACASAEWPDAPPFAVDDRPAVRIVLAAIRIDPRPRVRVAAGAVCCRSFHSFAEYLGKGKGDLGCCNQSKVICGLLKIDAGKWNIGKSRCLISRKQCITVVLLNRSADLIFRGL